MIRSTATIAVGTLIGQGLIFIATPFLSRNYSPAEFGSLALVLTITNLAVSIACSRFDTALPSAPKEKLAPLFVICLISTAFMAFAAVSFIIIFYHGMAVQLPEPLGDPIIVCLIVLLAGIQQAVVGLATNEHQYTKIAGLRSLQGAIFVLGALNKNVGLVAAQVASLIPSLPLAMRELVKGKVSIGEVKKTIKQFRSFPLVGLPGAILDVLGYSACIWLITYFFGTENAGQYSQVQRILGAPLLIIALSLTQVVLRASADRSDKPKELNNFFKKLVGYYFLFCLVSIILTALFGKNFLSAFLGGQWKVDISFTIPILLAVSIRAFVSPLSAILITIRRLDLVLYWQASYFISSMLVLGAVGYFFNFDFFIKIYAIHEILLYCIYYMVIKSAVGRP